MFLFTLCDFAAVFNILRFLAPWKAAGEGLPCIKGIQRISSTTPPSTRSAAPEVADACGEQT